MLFFIEIQKTVPNDSCSLEIQEMYLKNGQLIAVTKINGDLSESKDTAVKATQVSVECQPGLIKSLKNITVQNDDELKAELDKHKTERCFYSKSKAIKDSEIKIGHFLYLAPIPSKSSEISISEIGTKVKALNKNRWPIAAVAFGSLIGLFAVKALSKDSVINFLRGPKLGVVAQI